MRNLIFGILFLTSVILTGFIKNTEFKSLENGCAGANCHQYLPGFITLKQQNSLNILIEPDAQLKNHAISAELIDQEGKIVDFQKTPSRKPILLNAPGPGKYKVLVGYNFRKPYWDSLSVNVKPSVISIPSSRYGAVVFKLFPIHPNPARRAVITRFILPHNSDVEMTLYNAAGQRVKTIYSGSLISGLHSIYWETRDEFRHQLPSGSYLCELRSGSKKLVERVYIEG